MEKMKLILVAIFFNLAFTQLVKGQPGKDCQTSCGNVTISYPFGTSPGCYYPEDPSFKLTCNETEKRLFFNSTGGLEVINVSHSGELRVWVDMSYTCYDSQGNVSDKRYSKYTMGSLSLSAKNKLTLVGCNALALVSTLGMRNHSTACLSLCNSPPPENVGCKGEGCCITEVNPLLDSYEFETDSARLDDFPSVYHFNPCTYAFLAENGTFHFDSLRDLKNMRNVTKFPVVLDWSVGELSCHQVGNASICSRNATCVNSTRGKGYNCECFQGYDGNPYTDPLGCKDIDECTMGRHNCSSSSTCENTLGSFRCKCPSGRRLDTTDMSCKPKDFGWPIILLGTTIGFLVILLGIICVQERLKNRKYKKLRQKFFERNGGEMLVQRAGPSSEVHVKLFNEHVLNEATDNFNERNILGQGGQGTVYKGVLPDNTTVAIKKALVSEADDFVNEILLLSKINHRNVVKMIGCCLESEIPLLVYEFATNGTLFDHLHRSLFDTSLTWENRLRIAIQVARSLAYLHSSASVPIIHRDVKSANILLDDKLTAKLADFGASRLIPMDKEELATVVKGTHGYLDPEYYKTGLLNEKSDVFSYGIVLMELLTGKKAYCSERPHESKHLVDYFVSALKENRFHEIIDGQMMNETNKREIHEAARVAVECARVTGEERPKMEEVAAVLEALEDTKTKHHWSDQYPEDLVGVQILSAQGETSGKNVTS